MVNKTLKRAGLGFVLGIIIGYTIALLTGGGKLVADALVERTGSYVSALVLQTLLSGVFGAVSFAGISFYDIESWSLLKTALVHFLVIEAAYVPIAFALCWVRSAAEALVIVAINAVVYVIIFLIIYLRYRAEVRELNELQEQFLNDKNNGGQNEGKD